MQAHLPTWLNYLIRAGRRKTTRRDYKAHVSRFIQWMGNRALTPELLIEYREWLQTEKDPPNRPRTINATLTALRSYLGWLEQHFPELGFRAADVPAKVRTDQARRNVPEDEHVTAMLQAARRMPTGTLSKRYHRARAVAIIGLFAHTGLRRRELLDLNTGDVLQEGGKWILYIRSGKGGKPENMELNETALRFLLDYLPLRREWAEAHGCALSALWLVDKRRRLSDRGLADLFRDLCELAGMDARRFTPHCLRHWFGTTVAQETDAKTAQALLRHANFATTAEIYLHTNDKRKRDALDGLGRRLGENLPAEVQKAAESTPAPARQERPAREGIRSRRQPPRGFDRSKLGR